LRLSFYIKQHSILILYICSTTTNNKFPIKFVCTDDLGGQIGKIFANFFANWPPIGVKCQLALILICQLAPILYWHQLKISPICPPSWWYFSENLVYFVVNLYYYHSTTSTTSLLVLLLATVLPQLQLYYCDCRPSYS
jgi:hypothetical protein